MDNVALCCLLAMEIVAVHFVTTDYVAMDCGLVGFWRIPEFNTRLLTYERLVFDVICLIKEFLIYYNMLIKELVQFYM